MSADLRFERFDSNKPRSMRLLPEMVDVLTRAYGKQSSPDRILRYATHPEGRWYYGFSEDRLITVGGSLAYPDGHFGWIGLIATDPSAGRSGAGSAITRLIMEDLQERGCACALDASAAGAPVYRRLSYVDVGHSAAMERPQDAQPIKDMGTKITRVGLGDWAELERFDQEAFGASRELLLRRIASQLPDRFAIARDASNNIIGYVVGQAERIGPLVATEATAVNDLLRTAVTWYPDSASLCLDADTRFASTVQHCGFESKRLLPRQYFGLDRFPDQRLPGHRGFLVAQTSFGEG
jgi:hypothetical protein